MNLTKKTIGLIVGASLALTGSAIGASAIFSNDAPDGAPVQYSPSRGALPTVPGSPEEILSYLARNLTSISAPRIVIDHIPTENGQQSDETGQFLRYDLAVPSFDGGDSTEAIWEGQLFTGAVLDVLRDRGYGVLAGAEATLVTPDGKRRPIGGGFGKAVSNQLFAVVPTDLKEQIDRAAPELGLTDVQVERLDVLQTAVVIRATAPSEKTVNSLANSNPIERLIGRSPTDFEGSLLVVESEAGDPVYIVGGAPRAAGGIRWVDPAMGLSITR